MLGGPTKLLNHCLLETNRKCGMKFETTEQLNTHQKKFCFDNDSMPLGQLETKNLDNAKRNKKTFDPEVMKNEYDRLYNKEIQEREKEMQRELDKLKIDKANIRAKKQQEEEALVDLIKESEQKKERDLRAKIEKEQIQKELAHLEKAKLTALEQEKKTQLEKLAVDREALKQKEDHLMKEIARLEGDKNAMDRIREDDIKKQEDALDKFKQRGNENMRVNEFLVQEKSDRVAQLKVRREQLEFERQKIMGDLEKVRSGDLSSLRRSNYGVFAANQMLKDINGVKNYDISEMRDKIYEDEKKLERLKSGHRGVVPKEHIYSDFPYASPPSNPHIIPRDSHPSGLNKSLLNASQSVGVLPTRNYGHSLTSPEYDQQIPFEYKKTLNEKELENEKLKLELEMLKSNNNKSDSIKNENLTLADMHLKFNGVNGGPSNGFNLYANTEEFFLQNQARSVDLNEDERTLINLQAQEADALRLLSQLPVGTELYRFKMDQYKELSTMRAEAEKILQEHRLLKLRREYEKVRREEDRKFENEKWVDEQRKNVIAGRIRKELVPSPKDKSYDPLEGFVVHWDYCLGIPKRHDSCQLVFGIYINGTEIYPPKLIEPHPCEVDTAVTNRCIIGEQYSVNDIPANSNALIIFELQILPSRDSTNPRIASYGWSQLDLFDSRRELKKGKFKVPLYECPTNTSQDIDGIKNLTPVHDGISWVYLRISSPGENDYDSSYNLYPESSHMDYVIPQIHLRNYRPAETTFSQQPQTQDIPVRAMSSGNYQDPYEPYSQVPIRPNKNQSQESFIQPVKQYAKIPVYSQNIEEDLNMSTKIPDIQKVDYSQIAQSKRALQITVHSLQNHIARNHLRISCALLEEAKMVVDERGQNCVFNTTVHDPYQVEHRNQSYNSIRSQPKNQNEGNITFEEKHIFYLDINNLIRKSQGKRDCYLMFQVLEKPEKIGGHGISQTMSYRASNTSAYGKLEYDLFGWLLFKINKSNGSIYTGKFVRNLFSSPLKKPPFDFVNEKKSEAEIKFSIQEIELDNQDQSSDKSFEEDEKPKIKPALKSKNKISRSDIDKKSQDSIPHQSMKLRDDLFIHNNKMQHDNTLFEKGMGIDFYFDGCRFLPNNATIVKATVQIVDIDFNTVRQPESDLPDLNSSSHDPLYNMKVELRSSNMTSTSVAFITLSTIDEMTNQPKIVGYSGINLFVNRSTQALPHSNSETDIALFSGCYQLPIYCQEPIRSKPFTIERLQQLEKLPMASILVRINQAPLSNDNKILSLTDVPQKDWASKKVMIPRPNYGEGKYNTSLYHVNDTERVLFELGQQRENTTTRDIALAILQKNKVMKTKDFEITAWFDEKIQPNPSFGLLDMAYFAKYKPEFGFKFAFDGLHNAPSSQVYAALTMLNPPGGFYGNPPNPKQVGLSSVVDWEGPLTSPRFIEGYSTFKGIEPRKSTHIIVEIKTLNLSKKVPQISSVGWTVIPLFTSDGYFLTGMYQIPLITGEVNKNIIDAIIANDAHPWEVITQNITAKKIKWLSTSSIMIRLLDGQREGNLKYAWDFTRIDTRYLPNNNIQKYIYNANADNKARTGKMLKSIAPRKEDIQVYQQRITETLKQELKLV